MSVLQNNYKQRTLNGLFYLPGKIPPRKLVEAAHAYAPEFDPRREQVLLFLMNAVFSPVNGLILTDSNLYIRLEERPARYRIADLRSITVVEEIGRFSLLINGESAGRFKTGGRRDLRDLIRCLQLVELPVDPEIQVEQPPVSGSVAPVQPVDSDSSSPGSAGSLFGGLLLLLAASALVAFFVALLARD